MGKRRIKLLEAKYFGFIIGILVFGIFTLLNSFSLFTFLDMVVLDANFNLRSFIMPDTIQVGVSQQIKNPNISSDILIVGVDGRSLDRFGKWPWPRYRHADFLNVLSRIKNQNERENSVFLDYFFVEKSTQPEQDALLRQAIEDNGRVILETVLDSDAGNYESLSTFYESQHALYKKQAPLSKIYGDINTLPVYYGVQPPLKPFSLASAGFGHPNFKPDSDKTFRRQPMVIRFSELVKIIDFSSLDPQYSIDKINGERMSWTDKAGIDHPIPYPLSESELIKIKNNLIASAPPVLEDTNGDGTPDKQYYVINIYHDYFLPSLTLTLALRYFNKSINDIEVNIGEYIRIPSPQLYNSITASWEPYKIEITPAQYNDNQEVIKQPIYRYIPEIKIPIDNTCSMLINFMGPSSGDSSSIYQTYPVRSYAGYAARATTANQNEWPTTLSLANKIIMAGIFSQGTATDDKKTPFGIMYGIEVHANALNTILMDKFILPLHKWQSVVLLLFVCMFVSFLSSRLKTPIALAATLLSILLFYIVSTLLFEFNSILIDFAIPSFSMLSTMIFIIVYRVMTEEKEKQRIQIMFGKYVSKTVVDQMIEAGQQPELGGVDKELTVLFSDIRGFTTLSEAMTPQELVNHLNTYLTAMTDTIMDFKGTLDKYVGDEIMCFWGAPVPQSDHALLACKCALQQMQKLEELNKNWPPERRIDIGIGINSGIMTVGNMGSIGRMNYTLMGDNVNLGARLEGTNKQYYTHIIISEYTYGLIKEKAIVRELDNIRVKGKNKPVQIYELIDIKED